MLIQAVSGITFFKSHLSATQDFKPFKRGDLWTIHTCSYGQCSRKGWCKMKLALFNKDNHQINSNLPLERECFEWPVRMRSRWATRARTLRFFPTVGTGAKSKKKDLFSIFINRQVVFIISYILFVYFSFMLTMRLKDQINELLIPNWMQDFRLFGNLRLTITASWTQLVQLGAKKPQ